MAAAMTNDVKTHDLIAETAVSYLAQTGVASALVFRNAEKTFGGGSGKTVRIAVPNRIEAKNFNGTDELSAATEREVEVKITEAPYSSVPVRQDEATFDIRDFATQVLAPQVDGVARALEAAACAPMNKAIAAVKDTDTVHIIQRGDGFDLDWIVEAGTEMDANDVPEEGRWLLVGTELKGLILKHPDMKHADKSGSSDVLRRGEIGDLRGFKVYHSNALKGGAIAGVREAFALAVCPPVMGALGGGSLPLLSGKTISEDGYAIAVWTAWDQSGHSAVHTVKSFAGGAEIDPNRYVAFKLEAASGAAK
ncbi:P22 phage major capsid protein family protein [Kitasatospora sp. NPDC088351]|uniref:P22 phage major capsid protein family protein n=1 Tax=Kitasatospora sp. NPDC088351 TaxID=3155180 RepID=UPI003425537E